jgi:hypothetical protein
MKHRSEEKITGSQGTELLNMVLWAVTSCGLEDVYWLFGITHHPSLLYRNNVEISVASFFKDLRLIAEFPL